MLVKSFLLDKHPIFPHLRGEGLLILTKVQLLPSCLPSLPPSFTFFPLLHLRLLLLPARTQDAVEGAWTRTPHRQPRMLWRAPEPEPHIASLGCCGSHLDPNPCQREGRAECWIECQIECQKESQKGCQSRCQIERQNRCLFWNARMEPEQIDLSKLSPSAPRTSTWTCLAEVLLSLPLSVEAEAGADIETNLGG